jgi:ABC-type antimicrobial peptide transport system permease subunit
MVRELDPAIPLRDLRTLDDVAAASTQAQRARAVLVGGYAIVATLLALAGLYGVTSYGVSSRRREFAIRSALGARTGSIVRLAMRQSVGASLTGMLAGLALAVGLTRVLRGFLFAVEPADPLALGGAAIGLAIVATLAAAVPAFRAVRVDPIEPLRRA